ncbi:unnamed protein product [Rhizophagus irregularis]|nr:unnamed protein product [Rhizophagus irregularis]
MDELIGFSNKLLNYLYIYKPISYKFRVPSPNSGLSPLHMANAKLKGGFPDDNSAIITTQNYRYQTSDVICQNTLSSSVMFWE